ncbi:glycosyltransferase [Mycobacterium sp. RTGN5]|uniref:glycosyltransferase family 2 protein n=1 Tax=Mycobacterium sp. RTGN5 TaxID=3016522 RepID=UPI0029C7F27C|nr:glycosyltransferase [Mycobacterium sp. RTGN5]
MTAHEGCGVTPPEMYATSIIAGNAVNPVERAGSAPLPYRQRAPRLGLLTAILFALSLILVLPAVWVGVRHWRNDPLPFAATTHILTWSLLLTVGAAATALIVLLTAFHAAAAMRVLARDRNIPDPSRKLRRVGRLLLTPLGPGAVQRITNAPEVPDSELRDAAQTSLRLTVLVPAYNEQLTVAATIESLWAQTRPPDRVVVVADNCTDDTATVAREHGAEVLTTVDNSDKKAGALNQALTRMFEADIDVGDLVMVMDADSVIVPEFLQTALEHFEADADLMAVGGVFYGEQDRGLIQQLQRNEYVRYAREIGRRGGRVFVLSGTAGVFRAYALKAVADARGTLIPGVAGQVYDTAAMTEDNELTIALKSLGAEMRSPVQCRVTTELMPSLPALWKQRMRWERGALENVGAYGFTRATATYWFQQLAIGYGTIALNSYLLLAVVMWSATRTIYFDPIWSAIGLIFVVERVVTVWGAGWRGRLLALPLVIEIGYDLIIQAVYVKSLFDIVIGRKSGWNYVQREAETP